MRSAQQGMALLMAIMIVALVAIISINMLTQRQLQIYRTANLLYREQAYQYSLAIEKWGISVLAQDLEQEKKANKHVDSQQDIWNTQLDKLDVDSASVNGIILDLQGRFNLNNLVIKGKSQAKWLDAYKRLLSALGLAGTLADTLLDWMDSNEQPTGTNGAEDIYYIALDRPYRAANQPLAHISELLLIKGYDQKVFDTLKPYIFIAQDLTQININTSPDKILQAIVPGLSSSDAEALQVQIKETPFTDIQDFIKDPYVKNKAVDPSLIGVSSSYFFITSHVLIDKTEVSLQSILFRDIKGEIRVVSRQESLWYENTLQQSEQKSSPNKSSSKKNQSN